ncbi:MAG: 50S ribosomal protein L18 [Spirochaetales bacterium]|nr:MAG: 50S ribosomal protein L18 [Spirochaetales bacterium]
MIEKRERRIRRKRHIRKVVSGTAEKPRMSVFRSNAHIYIQVIDDVKGETIAAVNTVQKENRSMKPTAATAKNLGKQVGELLKGKSVNQVVFDRNGFLYHGVIKAIADGAREAGLQF